MSDETKIIQKAALGSDTTQIGEQNNFIAKLLASSAVIP